jgi:hypothetical protein
MRYPSLGHLATPFQKEVPPVKKNPIRDNVIQFAALVVAVCLGYRVGDWPGAAAGFLLFAVLILLIVRHKMAGAQEVGKARRAARLASASPVVDDPRGPHRE